MNHNEKVYVVLKRKLFVSLISQDITECFPMRKNVIHWQDKHCDEVFANEDTVTLGQF